MPSPGERQGGFVAGRAKREPEEGSVHQEVDVIKEGLTGTPCHPSSCLRDRDPGVHAKWTYLNPDY